MEAITLVKFSSVGQLEEAIKGIGPGDSVRLELAGSCTVDEAATLYRMLQDGFIFSRGRYEVEGASMDLLRRATRHFDQLDGLQTSLELAELDLKGKAPMKSICFDNVRAAANAVFTSADVSNARRLLDEVVIDAQRLGRVCRGLMFGDEDVVVAALTEKDLDWLTEDGAGVLVLAGDNGAVLAGGDGGELLPDLDGGERLPDLDSGKALAYGDGGELLPDDNSFAVLAGLGDDIGEALAGVGGPLLLAGLFDGDEALAGENVKEGPLPDQPLLVDQNVKENLAAWVQFKEETVIALMRLKIGKILEAIVRAKGRAVMG